MSILNGKIAGILASALTKANLPYPVSVTRLEPGAVDPSERWKEVEPVPTVLNGLGFIDTYSNDMVAQGVVLAIDRRIFITVVSMPLEPRVGDEVTARGETFTIVTVKTDPARALWELQARPNARAE